MKISELIVMLEILRNRVGDVAVLLKTEHGGDDLDAFGLNDVRWDPGTTPKRYEAVVLGPPYVLVPMGKSGFSNIEDGMPRLGSTWEA
ncbi:MAG: hypothetical protein V4750_02625 [Pseudomonadota bacterium]